MHLFFKRLITLSVFTLFPMILFSETISDSHMGYSVDLPQNWVCDKDTINQHFFYDTSGTYQSIIGITMTDFSSDSTYKTSLEWTRAHFLAYLITVRSTVSLFGEPLSDPYGSVVFYDSSSSTQSGYKSMELYAKFNSLLSDTMNWDEYIKYVAVNKKGYEIYVFGDTSDIVKNLSYYGDLINIIKIDSSSQAPVFRPLIYSNDKLKSSINTANLPEVFDLLGRGYRVSRGSNTNVPKKAAGIVLMKNLKYLNVLH